MSSLLDSILGNFNSGGFNPSSGHLPEDQVSTPPDMQPGESRSAGPGFGASGLAAALGLDPERAKTVLASLGGGLSSVKNSPFAGEVAANAAGGAIAGGNKAEDTAINQALKLQQINQRGRYRGKALVIDEETRRAAQADREGTLAEARNAVARAPGERAAIIERLRELGIGFQQ